MIDAIRRWRMVRVRALSWGPNGCYHVTISPRFGFSLPWRGKLRLRWAAHHGLQLVLWKRERWVVSRQLLGRSKVHGERSSNGRQ